jgi:chromate transporter
MVAATLAAVLTTWVTFVPCFLWIFLGAPFIEVLRDNRALTGSLSAITAAVVGVIANLAVWFGMHTLFQQVIKWQGFGLNVDVPVWATLDMPAMTLAAAAIIAIFGFKAKMIPVLLACAVAGMTWGLVVTA